MKWLAHARAAARNTRGVRCAYTLVGVGVLTRGRFTPPPPPPHAFCPMSAGFSPWLRQCSPAVESPTAASRRRPRRQPLCGFPLETPPSRLAGRNAGVVGNYLTIPSGLRSAARCTGGFTRGLNARPSVACAPVFGAHLCRFRHTAQDRSHAGCALAGDPLALSVCGQTTLVVILKRPANGRVQTNVPLKYQWKRPLFSVDLGLELEGFAHVAHQYRAA